MVGGQRSDFNAPIGSLLRHSSLLRQMVLPSAGVCRGTGGGLKVWLRSGGLQQQRSCALGRGAASARVTHTKTRRAHTKAAAGFLGAERTACRLRLLQGRRSLCLISISDTPTDPARHAHVDPHRALCLHPNFLPPSSNPTFPSIVFFSCIFIGCLNFGGHVGLKSLARSARSPPASIQPSNQIATLPSPNCTLPPAEPAEGSFACGGEGVGLLRSVCG